MDAIFSIGTSLHYSSCLRNMPHARSTRDASVPCNDMHDTVSLTDDVLPSLKGIPQRHFAPIHNDGAPADDAVSDDVVPIGHDSTDDDILEMEGTLLDAATKVKLAVIKRLEPSSSGPLHQDAV